MSQVGIFKPDVKYEEAFTLNFVNKGVNAYKQS